MNSRFKRWFSQCLSRRKGKNGKTVIESCPTSLVLLRSSPDTDQSSELHRLEYEGSVFSPTVSTPTTVQSAENADTSEDARLLLKEAGVRYHIDLFHDGENCQIRLNTDGSLLFDTVIRNVLRAIGCEDADTIDIDACCDVHWRFVLPITPLQVVPTRPLRDLLTRGVVHINPGDKKGAVDLVIMESMERLRNEYRDSLVGTKQKRTRVAVLISGDRDFAGPIRRLRQCGLPCILIYRQMITPSFLHLLPQEMALGIWGTTIEESTERNGNAVESADSKRLNKRLSFRKVPRACEEETDGLTNIIRENTEQDNTVQASSSSSSRVGTSEDLPPTGNDSYDDDIPDFKFQCAKDLYLFLMDRPDMAIEASHMQIFWNLHPEHRRDIGKVGNFCRSLKSEGWFVMTECSTSPIVSIVSKESRGDKTINQNIVKSKQSASSPSPRSRRGRKGKGSTATTTTTTTTTKQRPQQPQSVVTNCEQYTVVDVKSTVSMSDLDLPQSQSISPLDDCNDNAKQRRPTTKTTAGNNNENMSASLADEAPAASDNKDGHSRGQRSSWALMEWLFMGLLLAGFVIHIDQHYYHQAGHKQFTDLISHMDKHLPQSRQEMYEMIGQSMSMLHEYSQHGVHELQVHVSAWLIALKSYSSAVSLVVRDKVVSAADACTQLHIALQSIESYVSTFITDNDYHDFGLAGLTYADVDVAIWFKSAHQAFITLTALNDLPVHQYLPQQLHSFVTTITSIYCYITNYIINHIINSIDTTALTNHSHRIVEHSTQFVLTTYDLALRQFHYDLTTTATNNTTLVSL